jgi:hypothetical protein
MDEKSKKLPQSLYDALKKGPEAPKRRLSPANIKRIERVLRNPTPPKELLRLAEALKQAMEERYQRIAALNGAPQTFLVVKSFTSFTDERYAYARRFESSQKIALAYTGGAELILKPVHIVLAPRGKEVAVWMWADQKGWLMRDWVLTRCLRKGYLKEKDT